MSFQYKNPLTPLTALGNLSVQRTNIFGTNFSILSTGGYMEVYTLSDLYFTVPPVTVGLVEYSGNTIPLQLNIGNGSPFSFDVLTLNSDNISSGRRRIGMLVYVIGQNEFYQYQIPNFETLWNNATGATGIGGATVVFSDFGTTIKSNSPQGSAFISAWTANTIEGVGGETSTTAVWKKFVLTGGTASGDYLPLSGGTVTGDTIFTSGLTANTISASTYFNLPIDVFVTGATYSNGSATFTNNIGGTFILSGLTTPFTGGTVPGPIDCTGGLTASTISAGTYQNLPIDVFVTGGTYSLGTAIFTNNTGGTFTVTGFSNTFTGGTVTGATNFTNGLTANTISATTYLNLPVDVFVTGGTYSAGTATFTNNTGGTFTVTGFDSQDLYITGGTFDKNTETLTFTNNTGGTVAITGFTDIFVTGATYNDGSATFTNNTGGTFVLSGLTTPFTGGTVSGDTIFLSGLTANTISASTYLNLPIDVFVTGGTYSAGTATFTNNTGGTFTVTGFDSQDLYITGGTFDKNTETLTLTNNTGGTVVVTGFTDVYVTGATYLNGSATFTNNSGTTFTLTGLTTPFTGGTVSGDTIFLNGLTANTISAATYQNLPGGLLYFVSTSTPTATQSGDRWFNLNTGVEVVWIEDGDSNQWVQPFSVPGPLSPDAGYYQTTGITSSQTLSWNYTYWGVSASTNVDLILPTTTSKNGYYIIIKDESGNCGSYRIRVTPASGLIDGNNYIDMNINYMSLTFIVRNGNWYLI